MKEKKKYFTSSKNLILNYIKNINHSFSSKELYNYIIERNDNVGLTTIYRFLDELEINNKVKKFYDSNNVARYQYLDECENCNHFYLKCNMCGKLIHIDCDCIVELHDHILSNHKFKTDDKNIIISGICEECLEV